MLKNTSKAKRILEEENIFLVLCKGESSVKSNAENAKELYEFINENRSLKGYSCACRNVTNTTALLLAKAQIREIYCEALSCGGKMILAKNGISVYYHTLTDVVENRFYDKGCLVEKAVANITNPDAGFDIIKTVFEANN